MGDDGCVSEGMHTNAFGVKNGTLFTAPLSNRILDGITRAWVLNHAAELGLVIRESSIRADDLPLMAEIFLTGTTVDILGVHSVDGIKIGKGRAGGITPQALSPSQGEYQFLDRLDDDLLRHEAPVIIHH